MDTGNKWESDKRKQNDQNYDLIVINYLYQTKILTYLNYKHTLIWSKMAIKTKDFK